MNGCLSLEKIVTIYKYIYCFTPFNRSFYCHVLGSFIQGSTLYPESDRHSVD